MQVMGERLVGLRRLARRVQDDLADSTADYTELTGRFLDVEIDVRYEGTAARTKMEMEDGYPLMKLVSVDE